MDDIRAQRTPFAGELLLLLLLATLWGASYSFIKLGVATIVPITLIAARTLIAGMLLLAVARWRGIEMPTDVATWRRFAFQACLNSVIPWTLIVSTARWRRRWRRLRCARSWTPRVAKPRARRSAPSRA